MDIKPHAHRSRFSHCTLDEVRCALISPHGVETILRPKTFEVLRLLLQNPGRVVGRQEILDAVWPGGFVTEANINQCVMELRRAMGDVGTALLRTVPRRGYLLESAVIPEAPPPPAILPPRADDCPSIAVLPFRQEHSDAQEGYFADGIIEGIVHALSGLDQIFVVSRGSALAFAQVSVDPRLAGRELGVRYVLYGGVRRAGGRLRITTELTDTERGIILRHDHYEGDGGDLFALQDRISEQVVATIAPEVRAQELARALSKAPTNITAYDLVLRALDKLSRMDREGMDRARVLLCQAMAADPDSALPPRYLAWWHCMRVSQRWAEDPQAEAEAAARHADAALERDRGDAHALGLRAFLLAFMDHELTTARRMLDRAVAARPSAAMVWSWGAAVRVWQGDTAEAVAWAERGLRLAPFDPFTFFHEHILAMAHLAAGDFARALAAARSSHDANPRHVPNYGPLIASLVALGRMEEAREVARQLRLLEPGFTLRGFNLRTPLRGAVRELFVTRMRQAGVPD